MHSSEQTTKNGRSYEPQWHDEEWILWNPAREGELTIRGGEAVIVDTAQCPPWKAAMAVAQLRNVAAIVAVTTDQPGEAIVLWAYGTQSIRPGDVIGFAQENDEPPPKQTQSKPRKR